MISSRDRLVPSGLAILFLSRFCFIDIQPLLTKTCSFLPDNLSGVITCAPIVSDEDMSPPPESSNLHIHYNFSSILKKYFQKLPGTFSIAIQFIAVD